MHICKLKELTSHAMEIDQRRILFVPYQFSASNDPLDGATLNLKYESPFIINFENEPSPITHHVCFNLNS